MSKKKIRYGVVGAGWISQAAFMPGVAHTENSEMTAIVTSDDEKATELAKHYGIAHVCGYDGYDALLRSGDVDAVYVATPNERHREFVVPALEAGIHVLLEKPMATSSEDARAMNDAASRSSAKFMVAYRLHFESATLAAAQIVRNGGLGEIRSFTSVFTQHVAASNHRASGGYWAGPVPDMGTYPINAVRNLFDAEPQTVHAVGQRNPDAGLGDFDDTVAVTMTFSHGRTAQFTVSYAGEQIGRYTVVGMDGTLEVDPGFTFHSALEHRMKLKGGERVVRAFPKVDQFGGQTKYFSDCILEDRAPEPDGDEGLADVLVLEAIERALSSGTTQTLEARAGRSKLDPSLAMTLEPIEEPELVDASDPGKG